ncbi:hypothetical protein FGG08_000632 [Glutinoglossum americanum]|uniref:Uncharacterized protein n=1 Tax=Glutinoglossum americanum TaxID=1670608 RepID=A0A9P8IHZ3_9PEZI|nr:hypothetical protein FGG08_000632 [Glutinoglossum americanum]
MAIQHNTINATGTLDFSYRTFKISKPFRIASTTGEVNLVFELSQDEGLLTITISTSNTEKRIAILKVQCNVHLNDGENDPLPGTWLGISLFDRPTFLGALRFNNFRGKKWISADLTYSWSESTILSQTLTRSNRHSVYMDECGKGATFPEGEYEELELEITEEMDFSNNKISEHPSNLLPVSKLTIVKGIYRLLALTMPNNQTPHYFTVRIVRNRDNSSHGQMQLKAVPPSEKSWMRALSMDVSIGKEIAFQGHSLPETQYEGGIYMLCMDFPIPKYGTHFLEAILKMKFPVGSTITEMNTGAVDPETVMGDTEEEWVEVNLVENLHKSGRSESGKGIGHDIGSLK